jgi:hypothetical protein
MLVQAKDGLVELTGCDPRLESIRSQAHLSHPAFNQPG